MSELKSKSMKKRGRSLAGGGGHQLHQLRGGFPAGEGGGHEHPLSFILRSSSLSSITYINVLNSMLWIFYPVSQGAQWRGGVGGGWERQTWRLGRRARGGEAGRRWPRWRRRRWSWSRRGRRENLWRRGRGDNSVETELFSPPNWHPEFCFVLLPSVDIWLCFLLLIAGDKYNCPAFAINTPSIILFSWVIVWSDHQRTIHVMSHHHTKKELIRQK